MAEVDLRRPYRFDGQEGQVPGVFFEGGEDLAGGVVGAELYGHAQALGQGAGQGRGDPGRLAIGAALRQHRIAVVDRRP